VSAAPDESGVPAESAAPDETAPASVAPDASVAPAASPDADASAAPIAATDGSGPAAGVPTEGEFGELATALQDEFGRIDEVRQQNSVGPVVSAELIQQTFLLILVAAGAIMLWVTYRFRDFRMGVTAIIALLHDVIIVVGTFAILGTFIGLQIDALFVTAMLTVIGYSVHDTIVVFDRVRENRQRYLGEPLEAIVNQSLVQTLGRSLTTSLTLVLTLAALLLFGGEAIRPFTFALLIGVIAGTYSSIFVATPLFLDWHLYDDRRKADRPVEPKAKAKPSTA
jgi:preprotein translocase subunit SecF